MTDPGFTTAKQDMIRRQLRDRGIHDRRVLAAMQKVPRERFVSEQNSLQAYSDRALAIDCGQTISQPYIVALMTQALELSGSQKVLEIGTGSGYQTAILAELAGEVTSIERHEPLSFTAGERLGALGYQNVKLIHGDGTLGYPDAAPFDRVVVTAAALETPKALLDQLAEGGILVIPLGASDYQMLQAIHNQSPRPRTVNLCPCRFVPLVGAAR